MLDGLYEEIVLSLDFSSVELYLLHGSSSKLLLILFLWEANSFSSLLIILTPILLSCE
jgi:hypothetical protein